MVREKQTLILLIDHRESNINIEINKKLWHRRKGTGKRRKENKGKKKENER